MNEVAQALIVTPAALALVPCGSGNGLALHLGIPTTPRHALALIADPASRVAAIDTGAASGHPFCNAMGLGLDAEVSRRFNRLTRRGLPAYALTGYAAFRSHRPEPCVVFGAGRREELDIFVIAVANSDQYGNRAYIAPGARVDDGALDLVAVGPVTFLNALPLVARLFLGTLDRSSHVLGCATGTLSSCAGPRAHPHRRRNPPDRRLGGSDRAPAQPPPRRGPGQFLCKVQPPRPIRRQPFPDPR